MGKSIKIKLRSGEILKINRELRSVSPELYNDSKKFISIGYYIINKAEIEYIKTIYSFRTRLYFLKCKIRDYLNKK